MTTKRVTVTLRGETATRFADYRKQATIASLPDSIVLETLSASALNAWAKDNQDKVSQPDLPQGETLYARTRRLNKASRERQQKARTAKRK